MSPVAWLAVAALLLVLAVLQLIGQRALRRLGLRPNRTVTAIRVLNYLAVLGILAYALWRVTRP
ncbi:MAG: hypothetical protein IBX62_00500 [Coriobacteriia bacterium]|nr:hypothetical protein [Coriobacteriia bacterium]